MGTIAPPTGVEHAESCFSKRGGQSLSTAMARCFHDSSSSHRRSTVFCGLETLESRQLMSAGPVSRAAASYVYTETDNSNPGQNAVIAYKQSAAVR